MKIYYNKKIVDEIYINSENIHKTTNKMVEDINNNNEGFFAKKEKLNDLLRKLNNQTSTLRNYIVDTRNVYDRLEIKDEILDKDDIKKYEPLSYFDNYVKSIDYCLQTNQLFDENNSKISSLTNMLYMLFNINNYTEEYKLFLEIREFIRNNYRIDKYFNDKKNNKFPLLNELISSQDFKDYDNDDIYEGDYIYGSLLLHDNIEELDDLIRDIHTNLGEQTVIFSNISTSNRILSKDPHYINLVINTREYVENNTFYLVDSFPKNIKDEKRYNFNYPFVNNEEFNKTFNIKRIKDGIIKISTDDTITVEKLKLLDILGLTIYIGKKTDTDIIIEVKEVNPVDLFEQSINNIYSKLLIDINKNKNIGKEVLKVKEIGGRKMENENKEVKEENKTPLEDTEFDLEPIKINVDKEGEVENAEPVLPEPPIEEENIVETEVKEEVPAEKEEIPEETAEIDPVAEAMKTPLETQEIPEVSDEALKEAMDAPVNDIPTPVEPTTEEVANVDIPAPAEPTQPLTDPETNTPVENYENPEVNNEVPTEVKVEDALKAVDNIEGPAKSKAPLLIIIITLVALALIVGGIFLFKKLGTDEVKDTYELRAMQDMTMTVTEEFFDNNKSCQVFKNNELDEVETAKISYEGSVNAASEGEYEITCKYIEPVENKELTATRKIIVEYPLNADVDEVNKPIDVKVIYENNEVSKDKNNPTNVKKYALIRFEGSFIQQGARYLMYDANDVIIADKELNIYAPLIIDNADTTTIRIIQNEYEEFRYIKVVE